MSFKEPKAQIVRKSNALARARWNPESIWEPRLVALVASMIKPNDLDFQIYKIPIIDIIGKNPGGRDYKDIEKAVDKAMSRIVTLRDDHGWTKYTLFSKCKLDTKIGVLLIGFHPELKEHYLNLKQYMQYNLTEFMILSSVYSQRLFEILKSWDDRREVILELPDLHEVLDSPKSMRNNFAEFKRRVLDKAHRDINEHTALKYEWEPIKIGRTYKEIKFRFIKKLRTVEKTKNIQESNKIELPENIIKPKLDAFLAKFSDAGINHLFAGTKWFKLNSMGIAPLAKDVPDDNKLGVIEFLQNWQDKKQI